MLLQVKYCRIPEKGVVPSSWRINEELVDIAFTLSLKAGILQRIFDPPPEIIKMLGMCGRALQLFTNSQRFIER